MKKKKKFSRVKAVKQMARNVIGTPRPTGVRSGRKAGGSASALDPTLNQKDVSANPHYQPREEYIEGAPRISKVEGLHIKQPVMLRKPRQGPPPAGQSVTYSAEVIQHCNVLRASQGEKAVADYLSTLREQKEMAHTDIAERLTREHTAPQPVDGSIGAALKDAEMKLAYFETEIRRCTAECERWRQIAESLRNAIKLTVGEVTMPKLRGEDKAPRGFWRDTMRALLNRKGVPMARKEFLQALRDETGKDSSVYPATTQAMKKGEIIDVDGSIALPEWTNPR